MDDYEQKLKHTRLVAPSAALDRRIEDTFAAARRRREEARKSEFWWWLAALATVGGMTALVVISPRRSFPATEVAVYRIEAQGRLREILLNPAISREPAPQFIVRETTTP
jgi:hypothetical protein